MAPLIAFAPPAPLSLFRRRHHHHLQPSSSATHTPRRPLCATTPPPPPSSRAPPAPPLLSRLARTTTTTTTTTNPSPAAPKTLPSPAALKSLAASLPPASLIVLSLSAAHCRACAGAKPRFRKSAAAAASPRTVFAEMEVGPARPENAQLGQRLGARALPFFAIFRTTSPGEGEERGDVELIDGRPLPWNRMRELDEQVAKLQAA